MSAAGRPGDRAWTQRLADLSPEQRAYLARLMQQDRTVADGPSLRTRSRKGRDSWPCSFAQQRLWFLDRLVPGDPAHIIVSAARLPGRLDAAALERSLQVVVGRHEVLRTTFDEIDGEPVQVIGLPKPVPVTWVDLSCLALPDAESAVRACASDQASLPFDLARGPMLRATLLRLAPGDHVLLLALHHIVTDGWSMGVLFEELTKAYALEAAGRPGAEALPPLPIQYVDFALWQREWLSGTRLLKTLAYWREQLAGLARLELPTDLARPAVRSGRGESLTFQVPEKVTAGLQTLARQEGATLFMTLLAAFSTLLGRYCGQTDVAIGSPIANRTDVQLEGLIGFFVNTLVLRVSLADAPSFRTLLRRVKDIALGAYAHYDLPFERLVEELQPQRDLSRNPLFDVMMQLQPGVAGLRDANVLARRSPLVARQASVFDLSLDLWTWPEYLAGQFEYSTDLFERSTIERLAGHLLTLLDAAVASPDLPITELPLLSLSEREEMLVAWNATSRPLPDAAVHALIDAQAARVPDRVAIRAGAETLTYAAMTERATELAHKLHARGIGSESVVAVCLERSPDLLVTLLAVLKAGGAYLPLAPGSPPARVAAVLADAAANLVVTRTALRVELPDDGPACLCLDEVANEGSIATRAPMANLTHPDHLAYVVYTSGSTGTPKGVEISHRSLVNHALAMADAWRLVPDDRVLQLASIGFDVAAEEIFPALIHGATVCIADAAAAQSPDALADLIAREGISIVNLPTPMWEAWMDDLCVERMPTLRLLIVGSEQMSSSSYARWVQRHRNHPRLLHAYGLSEATITSVVAPLSGFSGDLSNNVETATPPIGRPIANTECYVLDGSGEPVPVGIGGELYLGGAGLARGYRGQPAVTAARFGPHRFRAAPARLYATGDRVRFRRDGQLEFLGRMDGQIKLHGFRIEPGEVEAALRRHPAVAEARVMRREDVAGLPRLVAYLIGHAGAVAAEEVTACVRRHLPAYMVPAAYVWLGRLPLTAHGKVDWAALPAPDVVRPTLGTRFVSPRTAVERTIAAVWSEVLQVREVGREDNFFDLGGRSLLLVRVHALLSARVAGPVSVLDLFRHPTVRALAAFLDAQSGASAPSQQHDQDGGTARISGHDGAEPQNVHSSLREEQA